MSLTASTVENTRGGIMPRNFTENVHFRATPEESELLGRLAELYGTKATALRYALKLLARKHQISGSLPNIPEARTKQTRHTN